MAEKLKTWPKNIESGGRVQYDWDLWLNGEIWKITQGKDFTCKLESLQSYVHLAARQRGLSVRTGLLRDTKAIVFQVIGTLPSTNGLVKKATRKPRLTHTKARKRVAKKTV